MIGLSPRTGGKVGPLLAFALVVIVVQPMAQRSAFLWPFVVDDDAVAVDVRFDPCRDRDKISYRVLEMIP